MKRVAQASPTCQTGQGGTQKANVILSNNEDKQTAKLSS